MCRVFKKKNQNRGNNFQSDFIHQEESFSHNIKNSSVASSSHNQMEARHNHNLQALYDYNNSFDHHGSCMHLPQLFSAESSAIANSSFISPLSLNSMDIECSQNLLRLTSTTAGGNGCGLNLMQHQQQQQDHDHQMRYNGTEWSFLDKLLTTQTQTMDSHSPQLNVATSSTQKFPFQYPASEADILKFS